LGFSGEFVDSCGVFGISEVFGVGIIPYLCFFGCGVVVGFRGFVCICGIFGFCGFCGIWLFVGFGVVLLYFDVTLAFSGSL